MTEFLHNGMYCPHCSHQVISGVDLERGRPAPSSCSACGRSVRARPQAPRVGSTNYGSNFKVPRSPSATAGINARAEAYRRKKGK